MTVKYEAELRVENESLRSTLTAVEAQRDEARAQLLVPGRMRCAKCDFVLTRTNLYVRSGTTGPGDSKTEPCPNGCGPPWPVTWEQDARDAWKRAEEINDRAVTAEYARDTLLKVLEELVAEVDAESPWRSWPQSKLAAWDAARAAIAAVRQTTEGQG